MAKARRLSGLLSQEAKLVLLSVYRLVAVALHGTDHQDLQNTACDCLRFTQVDTAVLRLKLMQVQV